MKHGRWSIHAAGPCGPGLAIQLLTVGLCMAQGAAMLTAQQSVWCGAGQGDECPWAAALSTLGADAVRSWKLPVLLTVTHFPGNDALTWFCKTSTVFIPLCWHYAGLCKSLSVLMSQCFTNAWKAPRSHVFPWHSMAKAMVSFFSVTCLYTVDSRKFWNTGRARVDVSAFSLWSSFFFLPDFFLLPSSSCICLCLWYTVILKLPSLFERPWHQRHSFFDSLD